MLAYKLTPLDKLSRREYEAEVNASAVKLFQIGSASTVIPHPVDQRGLSIVTWRKA